MNPEVLENKDEMVTTETTVTQEDINAAKIETPAVDTKKEAAVAEKKGFLSRLFGKSDKELRIEALKKQQTEEIKKTLEGTDQGKKLEAFRKKYGNEAYAQWDSETNEYKTPHSDTANRN